MSGPFTVIKINLKPKVPDSTSVSVSSGSVENSARNYQSQQSMDDNLDSIMCFNLCYQFITKLTGSSSNSASTQLKLINRSEHQLENSGNFPSQQSMNSQHDVSMFFNSLL